MKNLYKNMSVFRCVHESHKGFQNSMSVYHILKKKRCFPEGCVYFKWHCRLMKKGNKCYRGYDFVGKNCFGCRYFYEEKIHNFSELQIGEGEYEQFLKEFHDFEEWIEDHRNRELEIHGQVDGVKPRFSKRIYRNGEGIAFRGFMLIFREVYLNRTHLKDPAYALVSNKTYHSLKFGRGDVLTARATLTLERGRFILKKLHRFDIEKRGEPPLWTESKARVARETATHIAGQPEGCIQCPYGALIDVEDLRRREKRSYRQLYCLQGMADYRGCHHLAEYCGLDAEANDAIDPACIPEKRVGWVERARK